MDLNISVSDILIVQDTRFNLISNPSFETNTSGWYMDSPYTRITTDADTGSASIRLVGNGSFDNLFFPEFPYTTMTVLPHKVYTMRFKYKVENHTYGQPLPRVILARGDDPFNFNGFGSSYITLGNHETWSIATATVNTGTATSLFIRISANQTTATVYFDSFTLQLGTEDDYIETNTNTITLLPDFTKNQSLNNAIGDDLNMMLDKPKLAYWNNGGRPTGIVRHGTYGFNYEAGRLEVFIKRGFPDVPDDDDHWVYFPFQTANTLVPN